MKKLELEITCCEECPYCQYDCYYNTVQDSGWDCNHPNAKYLRIINDGERTREKIKTQVPNWRPLPDKK